MEAMKKTALLLGDITGRSRVAVRMLASVLEDRGVEVLALPTALISNTLNLGEHEALDTTDYLLSSIDMWEKLGISWDVLHIGYVTGEAQARALCGVAEAARAKGCPVVLDPILGDGGRRYLSVTDGQLEGMRLLMKQADLITPNLTEASLLADIPYEEAASGTVSDRLIDALSGDGERSVLITSARTQDGGHAMIGFDAESKNRFELPYQPLPVSRGGTGDLFSAILLQLLLVRMPLADAAQFAGYTVEGELRKPQSRWLPDLTL